MGDLAIRGTPILFKEPGAGGVNLADPIEELADNEARDARNVVGTLRGGLRNRDGSRTFATPASSLVTLYASVAPHYLIGAAGGALYAISAGGTVTSIGSGLGGNVWEFVNAPAKDGQGPVFGSNGSVARAWDGSLSSSVVPWTARKGTLPIGKYMLLKGGRVWVAGMSGYATDDPGSTLAWSNLFDARDWPGENVAEFDPNDGEAISGIGSVGPYVLVFKPSKAWLVYDLDTGANRPLGSTGCVSHRSIVETNYGTFFLSKDHGVMRTDGQTAKAVSAKVLPMFAQVPSPLRSNVAAAFIDEHLYVALSRGPAGNDTLLDFDVRRETWWPHSLGMSDLAVWDPDTSPRLFGAKSAQAKVSQLMVPGLVQDDVTSSGGVNQSGYWNGPFDTAGQPYRRKRLRRLVVDGKGPVQVSLAQDYSSIASVSAQNFPASTTQAGPAQYGVNDGSSWGTNDGTSYGTNDGSGTTTIADYGQVTIPEPGVARAWSVLLSFNSSEPWEVTDYSMLIVPRKD